MIDEIAYFDPSSKKSKLIRIVKEACEAVEALDGIPVKNSSWNASVNIESLCCELEHQPNLLQVRKEISFSSCGMSCRFFLVYLVALGLIERLMIVV